MNRILLILALLVACVFTASADRRRLMMGGNVASAAVDSPDDIANLFAWYKADALVTNTAASSPPSNGDSIMAWGDSSGNGRHLTTNRPATPPTWENAAGTGKSFGGMEGAATASLSVGFTAQANTTIFIVWRINSGATFVIPIDSTNASARQVLYKNNSPGFSAFSGTDLAGGNAVTGTWFIEAATFNSGGNDTLYTNSVAVVTGDAGNQSLDGLNLMTARDGTSSLGANEWVGEVVVYSRVLTSTEIGQVFTYLNGRWSVY